VACACGGGGDGGWVVVVDGQRLGAARRRGVVNQPTPGCQRATQGRQRAVGARPGAIAAVRPIPRAVDSNLLCTNSKHSQGRLPGIPSVRRLVGGGEGGRGVVLDDLLPCWPLVWFLVVASSVICNAHTKFKYIIISLIFCVNLCHQRTLQIAANFVSSCTITRRFVRRPAILTPLLGVFLNSILSSDLFLVSLAQ